MDRARAGRWVAVIAGFAVLIGVIALQHHISTDRGSGTDAPVTSTSPPGPGSTPPTSTAPSTAPATGSLATSVTAPTATPPSDDGSPTSRSAGTAPPPSTPGSGTTPAPTTARIDATFPGSAGTDLLAFAWSGQVGQRPSRVVRLDLASGDMVTTPIPPLDSSGPLSFVATPHLAIVRPLDDVAGYSVTPTGKVAELTGLLGTTPVIFPGPTRDQWWTLDWNDEVLRLRLADPDGAPTGSSVTVPSAIARFAEWSMRSDAAGYVLTTGLGGTYDIRPDGIELVTHGQVLAVGPHTFLLQECDDRGRCAVVALDRDTTERRDIPALAGDAQYGTTGIVSPDGHTAFVTVEPGDGNARRLLVDLDTGRTRDLPTDLLPPDGLPGLQTAAFSPDGQFLFVCADSTVYPIVVATGDRLDPLPMTQVRGLAVVRGP